MASPSSAIVAPRRSARPRRGRRTRPADGSCPAMVPAAIAGCKHATPARRRWCGRAPGRCTATGARRWQRRRRRARSGRSGPRRRARPCGSAKPRAPGTSSVKRRRRSSSRLATAVTVPAGARKGDAERCPDPTRADERRCADGRRRRGRQCRAECWLVRRRARCRASHRHCRREQPGVYSRSSIARPAAGTPVRCRPAPPTACGDQEARTR